MGEAFNNAVIHAYADRDPGAVELDMSWTADSVSIEIRDTGAILDLDSVPPPDLSLANERGMGIYIIRSLVDEVHYEAGSWGKPNVLTLVKRTLPGLGLQLESKRPPPNTDSQQG